MERIAVAKCPDYNEKNVSLALDQVLEQLGGLKWIRPGMRIILKPNLVSRLNPERAATVHPQILIELTKRIRERKAEVIVGDSPGGLFTSGALSAVYEGTGMNRVIAAGAKLNEDFSIAEAVFPEALEARRFLYTAYLRDADAIINICKLKSHAMMNMSGAVKNMYGAVPGIVKTEYHYQYADHERFAKMLIDIIGYFKPILNLCDAITAMEGNGPTNGTPRHVGLLLGSRCPHSLDLACASVIGYDGVREIETLRQAYLQGWIPDNAEKLPGGDRLHSLSVSDFKRATASSSLRFEDHLPHFLRGIGKNVLYGLLAPEPMVESARCTGCGRCKKLCPAHAISITEKGCVIHRKKCIRCFCCQEFCPQGAIVSKRRAAARLLIR